MTKKKTAKAGTTPAQGRYGGPGKGLTFPPYYRPTPSVKSGTTFFPTAEELGEDEMRITFAGSCPFPPRLSQAGTCILVELGNGRTFFFDFGAGCLRNLVALQFPMPCINDVFLTNLAAASYGDLPYMYAFAPWMGRWKPLRLHGPSGRTAEEGTAAMAAGMQKMAHWHTKAFSACPVGDGYEVEVNEFDWQDDGGVCYEQDGVVIRHWGRAHNMSGATGYRLDWNGLSFAWTGDGRPDQTTIDICEGVDVFVTGMQLDTGAIAAAKTGVPEALYDYSTDMAHTDHYGAGYLISQVDPRMGMVTSTAVDDSLVNEVLAGIGTHWDGLFAFGAPDGVVVNVTAEAIWNREASMPESANNRRATGLSELRTMFGGEIPETLEIPHAQYTFAELNTEEALSHEISAEVFAPANVQRPLVREFPPTLAGKELPVAMLLGAKQVSDSFQQLTSDCRGLVEGSGQFTSGLVEKAIPSDAVGRQAARGVDAVTDAWTSALSGAVHAQRSMRQRVMSAAQSRQSPGPKDGTEDEHHARGMIFDAASKLTATLHPTAQATGGAEEATAVAAAVRPAGTQTKNPYGGAPGGGITLPDYYRPTASVKNATTYFPQSEQLGADEMRVTFMGSCPVPPHRDQAATSILVELGNGKSFVFDFGPGCLRNFVAAQVPVSTINDIFLTHLHVDHYGELPYLYGTAPWMGRYTPLRVHGPSGRRPDEGTAAMIEGMKRMTRWNTTAYSTVPTGRGFEIDVNEFDYLDDGGICYQQDGVTVRHWRRIHNMSGASGYRLDWNGLSFVWTGDGRPDDITIAQCQGVDLFVTELQLDTGALVALKSGVPEVIYDLTIDLVHTDHYATGYMMSQVNPRAGMVTHTPYDRGLMNECIAGVRTHWDGLFAFGAPDGVVTNVTKDAIWNRHSAWPNAANPRPATTPDELDAAWGDELRTVPAPTHKITDLTDKKRLATAIPYDRFVPANVDRPHRRQFPREPINTQPPIKTAAPA